MTNSKKELIDYNVWCHRIAKTGYIASALTIVAHVIWYFADRNTMKVSPELYPYYYILLPSVFLLAVNVLVDKAVHSIRVPLLTKEYFALLIYVIIPFYLSSTHNNVVALLSLYMFPIVASSIFSNKRLAGRVFMTSMAGILVAFGKAYIERKLTREMLMGGFIMCFALVSMKFLTQELIHFGKSNLEAMNKTNKEACNNELAFYQAQINPHFLCNAINTVISLCYQDGEKAASLLATVVQYLQFTFDINNKLIMITLEKELQLIRAYVEIEKARFGDLIAVEYVIEPELLHMEIPSFCLQPLVENAIKHGLCKKEKGGAVTIIAKKEKDMLLLSVNDTGVGMSDEKRNRLMNCTDSSEGIGFFNVKRRVMGWKNALFDIQSKEGDGTTVTISVFDDVTE